MQNAIKSLELWPQTTDFCFSPEKTKCVIFTKRKKIHSPRVILNHEYLNFCDKIKYLGITCDSKLNWQKHITNLRKECNNRMKLLKILAHQNWGAETIVLIRFYTRLLYAIAYRSAKPNILKKLNPIQNTSLRIA